MPLLLSAIAAQAASAATPVSSAASLGTRSGRKRRILVVDDEKNIRRTVQHSLIAADYEVETAANGAEGLDRFRDGHYDLILMDVALGEMDGWEATQLIKGAPATAQIPIIALTAHALASDRHRSIEVGCDGFETKPVDLPRLLEKITARLSRHDANSATTADHDLRGGQASLHAAS